VGSKKLNLLKSLKLLTAFLTVFCFREKVKVCDIKALPLSLMKEWE